MQNKSKWKGKIQFLNKKLEDYNSPYFVFDSEGAILAYSRFFERVLRSHAEPTVFDLLPKMRPSAFSDAWQRIQRENLIRLDGQIRYRRDLIVTVPFRWLRLEDGLIYAVADLPGSNRYLDFLIQSEADFSKTIFWEVNFLSNTCIIGGGQVLKQFGLQEGFHRFQRARLRQIIRRNFSAIAYTALLERLEEAQQKGMSFQEEVTGLSSYGEWAGRIYCSPTEPDQPAHLLCGQFINLSELREQQQPLPTSGKTTLLNLQLPIKSLSPFHYLKTASKAYLRLLRQAELVAQTETTVLISGETGTGKELLARIIHENSQRAEQPMVKVNCAAIPHRLFESTIFGHEKGAFTGAYQRHAGKFEQAAGGTLFLDEIGEMPYSVQHKLLRVLQEGEFERVGGIQTLKSNVRIIAATNRDLQQMTNEGSFRKDLFYRLNVFPIVNPPLRNRPEDIPLLVQHFVRKHTADWQNPPETVLPHSMKLLLDYHFPGNIRELENLIERALIMAEGSYLDLSSSFDLNSGDS